MKTFKPMILALLTSAIVFTGCEKDEPAPTPDTSTLYQTSEIKDGSGNVIETIVTVTDRGKGTGTMTWTSNKTYVLNGLVFVNANQTLSIEEGTVVKGKSGQGETLLR